MLDKHGLCECDVSQMIKTTLELLEYVGICIHITDIGKELYCNVFPSDVRGLMWIPASILYKSIAGRYRPVRVADGPITARYRFIKNASWDRSVSVFTLLLTRTNKKKKKKKNKE